VTVRHRSLTFKGFGNLDATILFSVSLTRMPILDNRHVEPDGGYYALPDDDAATATGLVWRNAIVHMFSSRHPDEVCSEIAANIERYDAGD